MPPSNAGKVEFLRADEIECKAAMANENFVGNFNFVFINIEQNAMF